eukprot:CAMPEP_0119343684 /NCGR_PEP_ID=MMETSP1333-20130426/106579_1 /TAXON_ID=418940 /ORGANISM="Scyphosphaera apsteinii, Strain RCC1455" /LENGTH=470 /DNA_ID=CAMNT_0007356091 /DNA_START=251 /DNA_END=1663 /DNA_ORIENTATION=-
MELDQTVIEIPNGPEVNYLIGTKGAGVNALQDATGTRIQIQRSHEVPLGALVRKVTISGGEVQRSNCALLIQTKIQECQERDQARANGNRTFGDGVASAQGTPWAAAAAGPQQDYAMGMELDQTVIDIPNGPEVNYLIGTKGAGVNALQDATGTRIQIQRSHEVPLGALVRKVTISGGEAQRLECAQLIQSKVQECQERDQARVTCKRKFGDDVTSAPGTQGAAGAPQDQSVIEIPNGPAVNYLIGTQGAGVKALEEATGTRIKIQRTHEVPMGAIMRSVTILGGDLGQRSQCSQMIQQKIQECQKRDQARISAQPRGMGGFGGMGMPPLNSPGGMPMYGNQMQETWMQIPNGLGMGSMPMHDNLSETIIEIPNGPAVNYLIGTKGAGVSALQDATGCRIQIQRTHEVPPGALRRSVKISGGDAQRQYSCAQLIRSKITECQQRDQARVNGGGGMQGPPMMFDNPIMNTV